MSKMISVENRVWTRSFIAENSFFGPYQVDVTQLIKTVQVLDTPSTQFKVSAIDFLLNLAVHVLWHFNSGVPNLEAIKRHQKSILYGLDAVILWF